MKSNNDNVQNKDKSFKGYTIDVGYIKKEPQKVVINSFDELKDYCDKYNKYVYDGKGNIVYGMLDDLLKNYNENFFNNSSLALEYIELSSGNSSVEFDFAKKIGNNVQILYNINSSKFETADMSGYLIIVEVTKDITGIL